MLLSEMSLEYQKSHAAIRLRMKELREAARANPGKADIFQARIRDLNPLRREARELAELTARYYDRSYHKNESFTL